MRGLAPPHPILGAILVLGSWLGPLVAPCIWQSLFRCPASFCCASVLSAYGSTVATCYVSLQRPGNFTRFLREGGPRILRSFSSCCWSSCGLLVTMHLVLCFLRLCHVWLGIMAVLDKKHIDAVACARLGFLVFFSSRCVPHVVQP